LRRRFRDASHAMKRAHSGTRALVVRASLVRRRAISTAYATYAKLALRKKRVTFLMPSLEAPGPWTSTTKKMVTRCSTM
jgi:hypothetical protein